MPLQRVAVSGRYWTSTPSFLTLLIIQALRTPDCSPAASMHPARGALEGCVTTAPRARPASGFFGNKASTRRAGRCTNWQHTYARLPVHIPRPDGQIARSGLRRTTKLGHLARGGFPRHRQAHPGQRD
jgi:hypothetical protein